MELKYIIFSTALTIAMLSVTGCSSKQEDCQQEDEISAADYNVSRAEELIDDIFKFIALIEGDKGEGKPYFCGARWTMWYGTTVKPDGSLIKKNTPPVSRQTGKEWCYFHLQNRVFPFFCHFTRKLTDEQIIGTALFMYNIGGETVTGYSLEGKYRQEASQFLIAVNQGKSDDYCVNCMTRYRKSAGKRANGLLKRHWVQGAAYKGILTAENIMCLKPEQFYLTKNFGNYYWLNGKRQIIEKNGLYQLRFDDTTISAFFQMNKAKANGKSVASIIP